MVEKRGNKEGKWEKGKERLEKKEGLKEGKVKKRKGKRLEKEKLVNRKRL